MSDNPEYTGYGVGCKLVKYFPGYGWFEGTIEEIRLEAAQNKTRRITYSDGDCEDLSIDEIKRARKSYAMKLSRDRKKDVMDSDGCHVSPFPSLENSQMLPCTDNATAAVTQEPFPTEITPNNSLQQQSTARRSSSRKRSVTFESLDMPTPTQIDTAGLSNDYEITRAQNVERNQNRLLSLGLISESEANAAIDAAWKRTSANDITPNSALSSSTSNRRSIVSQSRDTEITPSSDSTLPSSSTTTSSSTASSSSSSRRRGVLANDEDAAATSLLTLRNQETFNPYSLPARPSSRVDNTDANSNPLLPQYELYMNRNSGGVAGHFSHVPVFLPRNSAITIEEEGVSAETLTNRRSKRQCVSTDEDESDRTDMDTSREESDQEEGNVNWVQCDICEKWRKISSRLSAKERNDDWNCQMNPRSNASCDDPQEPYSEDDDDDSIGTEADAYEYFSDEDDNYEEELYVPEDADGTEGLESAAKDTSADRLEVPRDIGQVGPDENEPPALDDSAFPNVVCDYALYCDHVVYIHSMF